MESNGGSTLGSKSAIKCGGNLSRLFEALTKEETEHRSPQAERHAVARPHVFAPPAPAEIAVPSQSAKEAEREHRSQKMASLAVNSSDAASRDVSLVEAVPPETIQEAEKLNEFLPTSAQTIEAHPVPVKALPESHLVALTDPNSLGAEKFRALVTRLDDMRKQSPLKSFQVTSSVINEGKSVVAGNVAITLAKYSGSKTLLVEGDLHRPMLTSLLGLEFTGLSHWWSGPNPELTQFIHRLQDMPLWFLSAGEVLDRPSDILRSTRFVKAFAQLATQFEWIVVDSTPMLPIVDVNLWSKLVDGTLLVVREGLTPLKALKKGLQALDRPKLIGIVTNETSESDQVNYEGQSYGARKPVARRFAKMS